MNGLAKPESFDQHAPAVRIVVASVEGSAPREAGAVLWVSQTQTFGTIGGGRLEFEAIAHARAMMARSAGDEEWRRDLRAWPLGPSLGQCCGGAVRILFERYGGKETATVAGIVSEASGDAMVLHPLRSGEPPLLIRDRQHARTLGLPLARAMLDMLSGARPRAAIYVPGPDNQSGWYIEPVQQQPIPLFLYGAGHVGREIVRIAAGLDFDLHWVDTHADRFPESTPASVTIVPARQPEKIAAAAPANAFHLVLTYSHALDFDICRTLLASGAFGFLGLIGSQTKRTRFLRRLAASGIATHALTRLTCPIGIAALKGKEPATIAVGVAAQLVVVRETLLERRRGEHLGQDGAEEQISA
ncbi:MAG: xanthine dehydrogenase accessory protein XdhC [Hyphomicrobiales bacterium]|nr:xanthine dehydrogenase accessory protein XdhC [Hyphomicrobiales bacterium]